MSTDTTSSDTKRRAVWVCDNCHRETRLTRKRCAECGTSRY